MFKALEKKILFIRQQPEEIRMRYLFVCLFVSMFFIIIIWLFSLQESAREITKTKIILPPTEEIKNEGKSLEALINSDQPLRVDSQGSTENPLNQDLEKLEDKK